VVSGKEQERQERDRRASSIIGAGAFTSSKIEALQDSCCECHAAINGHFRRLVGWSPNFEYHAGIAKPWPQSADACAFSMWLKPGGRYRIVYSSS
jgi:hypothetical protein